MKLLKENKNINKMLNKTINNLLIKEFDLTADCNNNIILTVKGIREDSLVHEPYYQALRTDK